MMIFICYSKCSTCKKAEQWLNDNNISYDKREIKEDNPTAKELELWHKKSGLPLKRFFNSSGMIYREQNLKEKLETMTDEEQYKLLATDGMLVKRPLVVGDNLVLVGFKETEWQAKIK